jgi:hypothetical protein
VFVVEQLEPVKRKVALKDIKPGLKGIKPGLKGIKPGLKGIKPGLTVVRCRPRSGTSHKAQRSSVRVGTEVGRWSGLR